MLPIVFHNTKLSPSRQQLAGLHRFPGIIPNQKNCNAMQFISGILFFAVSILFFTHCKGNRSNDNSGLTEIVGMDSSQKAALIILTPDEMLSEILTQKVVIDPQLVNPLTNSEKYFNSKSQALNLGVYIADFNYLNLYDNKTNALEYFSVMRDLARKININVNFNEDFFNRVQNNLAKNDSLKKIFKEVFLNMSKILEKSNRQTVYALISLGASAEILYLSAMSVTNFSEYQSVVNRIFDQKYVFNDIYEYSANFKDDKEIGPILIQLDNIRLVMENAENKSVDTTNIGIDQDKSDIKTARSTKADEATFTNLKKMISNTRQNIINIFNY